MLESPLAAITAVGLFLGKSIIVEHLHIILLKILQALSSWLLIIARQPFSSLEIDFQVVLSQN